MSESEFGKVLEKVGWETRSRQGMNIATYKDFLACEWPWGIGMYLGLTDYWTPEDPCLIRAEDEHQVLRIVAAIEGTDRWRTDKPLEGVKYELKTVPHDLRQNKVDILLNCTFDSGLWMDGNGARLGATRVLAWRPCLDAYWEVAK